MLAWKARGCTAMGVAVVFMTTYIALRPVLVKKSRCGKIPRSGTLEIISDPDDAQFEIIAVHGLGADSDYTWSHSVPEYLIDRDNIQDSAYCPRIHLLRDLLSKDFPKARILSFAYNSRWLLDAPIKTTEEIGESFLKEIQVKRPSRRLPIIFIGHSLGGLVIKQALCRADSRPIINDTCGILFLGTPHQGSPVSALGSILAFISGFLGSDSTLLLSLGSYENQLSNLHSAFDSCIRKRRHESALSIWSFYETKPTYLFKCISLGKVVSRPSAVVHADEQVAIDTDHSGLNKCTGFEDQLYQKLRNAIVMLKAPSLLEQADNVLRDTCYAGSRLKIVRLSGEELLMDQCYINLAIVEKIGNEAAGQKNEEVSGFSLLARQKVQTPPDTSQVEPSTIFSQHETHGKRIIEPRRILIRGRAGVGKTTLCKKMIYDFTRTTETALNVSWKKLFDRVLWVQLRSLKDLPNTEYNLESLFYHEYFSQNGCDHGRVLAQELLKELQNTASRTTLFILDGLDEVTHELARRDLMSRLIMDLLCQPNVIITSRPNAALPASVNSIDLELETIGFYPDQVKVYLEADPRTKESAVKIQTFLNTHWLMQGLMRIPIQLDALCYTWEDFSGGDVPDTMTRIYNAIEAKLWKKDVVRLGKMTEGETRQALPNELLRRTQPETNFLECLAFNGLCNDVINFTSEHRDRLVGKFSLILTVNDTMSSLSFLRSSESSRHEDRSYHFIHLTFQEYFAARYLARHWIDNKPLEYFFSTGQELPSDPIKFLQQNKYSPRYDVFWRFVAGFLSTFNKIGDFFHEIEKAPRDLLGPIHQRLIMHCLIEVPRESELSCRKDLERGLAKWLLFEYEINQSVSLAKDIEFPLHTLHEAFCEGSDEMKLMAISRMCGREEMPASFLERGLLWLESDDYNFRSSAVHLLSLRPAVPEDFLEQMAAQLTKDEPAIPRAVVEVLINRKNLPEQILEKIVSSVEDKRGMNQKTAFKILANQRTFSAKISKSIRPWQKSEDRMIRMGAVVISISQDEVSPEVLENMASFLEDEDETLQLATLECLGALSFLPDVVLEGIAARLEDESLSVRLAALKALRAQKKLPEKIQNTLSKGLENEDRSIRYQTLRAFLGRLNLSIEVLRGLCSRIENDDYDRNKTYASWVLSNQLTDEIILRLANGLENGDLVVRKIIMYTLRDCHFLPENAIESVAARMEDPDRGIRGSALLCLICQQTLPDHLLQDLTMGLEEENKSFQELEAAVQCVSKKPRKSLSAKVLNCAYEMVEEKESYGRLCAVKCLGMQQFLPEPYLHGIVARLQDDDRDVREAAIDALDDRVLSEDVLNHIVILLDAKTLTTQLTVEVVLRKRKGLYQDLLNRRHAETLYQALLRSSFAEHVTWTIHDGVSSVTLGEDVREASISNPTDYLNGILKARPASHPSMSSGPHNI